MPKSGRRRRYGSTLDDDIDKLTVTGRRAGTKRLRRRLRRFLNQRHDLLITLRLQFERQDACVLPHCE
jgi:hypothetical protein